MAQLKKNDRRLWSILFLALYLPAIAPTANAIQTRGDRVEPLFQIAQQPRSDRATQLLQEGLQLYRQGSLESRQQAIAKWQEALPLFRAAGDKPNEALTLLAIGRVYFALGEKQRALEFLNQSLTLSRAVGDRSKEATTLNNIGLVYSDLGEKQRALEFLNQSLPLSRAVGNRTQEAITLNNIGLVYSDLGEKQKALSYYNLSLPLSRAVGDRSEEAATLNNIGLVYDALGEKQKALEFYNQSLPLSRAVGDRSTEAATLNNIGQVYDALGEKQKALEFYNQSLPLSRAVGNRSGEATTLNNIGAVYDALGEKQKALSYYNLSLPLSRAVGDRLVEAAILNKIGGVYAYLGEQQKALEYYNLSLPLSRAVGNRSGEAATLNNIGGVYADLGEQQKALEYYNLSLPLSRAVGERFGEAATLNNIGQVYDALGEKQKALEFYNQSLPLSRAVGDRSGEAATLNNIGQVYDALGEKQKALEFYNQSLPLSRAVGDRSTEAATLNNIGAVYFTLGEKQKALSYYNLSLPLLRAVGNKSGEAATLGNLADLERSKGNLKAALTHMEASLKIIEDLRTKIVSPELRTSYFASVQDYYQFYIDLLMQLHKQQPNKGYDALALQANERARARTLIELLTESNADIRQGVSSQLLQQEQTLLQKLQALEKRRIEVLSGKPTPEQVAALDKENSELQAQYQQIQTQIRAASPRYAALKYPQPLTVAQIQQQVLDDNTVLLEYSLGEERSYVWVVTKTSLDSYELPKGADIEAATKKFYQLLTDRRSVDFRKDELEQTGKELSKILLNPVAKELGQKSPNTLGLTSPPAPLLQGEGGKIPFSLIGKNFPPALVGKGGRGVRSAQSNNPQPKRLVIVADGALEYIPFAALPAPNSNRLLLVDREVINLPSASTLATIRQETKGRKPAPKSIAVLADPVFTPDDPRLKPSAGKTTPANAAENLDRLALTRSATESEVEFARLPNTRTEAEEIAKLIPATDLKLDFAANLTTATSPQLSQYRIVHFATHGILNSVNPELSGVVLSLVNEKGQSENGFLRLRDIFNLNLPADLVVLSACQTGLGKEIRGEGIVGLTRGFMYAGSPRLVVSLWNVNDAATAKLMTKLYQGMLSKGLPPAVALRQAQLEMLKQPEYQAPYYWAAFVMQGEWN